MRRSTQIVAASIAALLALIALSSVAWHAYAAHAYRASWDAGSVRARLAAASTAARMEPWNREFQVRGEWARGDAELESGDYNAAVKSLAEAYRQDVGNAELLALFKRAQQIQALETVKKAHLQHGHEGPGGSLRPEDIER